MKVYKLARNQTINGITYHAGKSYVVPTKQPQYRMVQSAFETYSEYTDSVYYDASAWSLANFYNIPYAASSTFQNGEEVKTIEQIVNTPERSAYAYIMPWNDYNAPAA